MLTITDTILDRIIDHARRALPEEACGYLAAHGEVITRHYELTNTDHSAEHFSMDPAEQFAAVRDCRARGLTVRAVYHSHPATPARPSAEDLRLARDPNMSYVIVSLLDATPAVKSFTLDNGALQEEGIQLAGNPTP